MEIFELKKLHFSKWLTPRVKTFVLRKGTVQIGQKCVDSLSKRLIYNLLIGRNILHKCDKKRLNV